MTRKRRILELLKRDALLAAVDHFELAVDDRRVSAQLVDALAGSRKAALADVLAPLSRDRLKELCRALNLDDRGRAKDELVARLRLYLDRRGGESAGGVKNGTGNPGPHLPRRTFRPNPPD